MAKKNQNTIEEARKEIAVDAYVSEGGLKTIYPHPRQIFEPFLDRLAGDFPVERVTVETMRPVATREEDGGEHKAYGRMKVEALIGDVDSFDHRITVGKIYVFDHKNAHYIIYGGRRAMACLNLHVLSADSLFTVNATDGSFGNEQTNRLLDNLYADNEAWIAHVNALQSISLDRAALDRALGELLIRSVSPVKTDDGFGFGSEIVANSAKLLTDGTSRYSVDPDGNTNAWNVLQSVTQGVSSRTYMNQAPHKTLAVVNAVRGVFNVN